MRGRGRARRRASMWACGCPAPGIHRQCQPATDAAGALEGGGGSRGGRRVYGSKPACSLPDAAAISSLRGTTPCISIYSTHRPCHATSSHNRAHSGPRSSLCQPEISSSLQRPSEAFVRCQPDTNQAYSCPLKQFLPPRMNSSLQRPSEAVSATPEMKSSPQPPPQNKKNANFPACVACHSTPKSQPLQTKMSTASVRYC